jgi:hypothetical protein
MHHALRTRTGSQRFDLVAESREQAIDRQMKHRIAGRRVTRCQHPRLGLEREAGEREPRVGRLANDHVPHQAGIDEAACIEVRRIERCNRG